MNLSGRLAASDRLLIVVSAGVLPPLACLTVWMALGQAGSGLTVDVLAGTMMLGFGILVGGFLGLRQGHRLRVIDRVLERAERVVPVRVEGALRWVLLETGVAALGTALLAGLLLGSGPGAALAVVALAATLIVLIPLHAVHARLLETSYAERAAGSRVYPLWLRVSLVTLVLPLAMLVFLWAVAPPTHARALLLIVLFGIIQATMLALLLDQLYRTVAQAVGQEDGAVSLDELGQSVWRRRQEVATAADQRRELTASASDHVAALAAIADGVIVVDEDGLVRMLNPAAATLIGGECSLLIGQPLRAVLQLETVSDGMPQTDLARQALAHRSMVVVNEDLHLRRKDGSTLRVSVSANPMGTSGATPLGVVLVIHDISEQFALRDQLNRSQQLEAVGQLASGIAHDFNNILAGIMGNAELMLRRVAESDVRLQPQVQGILTSAERGAALTAKLATLARRKDAHHSVIDLHDCIEEAVQVLRHTLDRGITITSHLVARSRRVLGQTDRLQTMIVQLGVNARDAMPGGGELRIISTDCQVLPGDASGLGPGDYVRVTVVDDGQGIAPQYLGRVFQPGFSTKSGHQASGLGLATVERCVLDHGGHIAISSQLGRGTSFIIHLPVQRVGSSSSLRLSTRLPSGTRAHLLVVDDEAGVREVLACQLTELGHAVTAAPDGPAALALLDGAQDFDLVLLDLNMPKMAGAAVLDALLERHPGLPVVISSGDGSVRERLVDHPVVVDTIDKPYRLQQLAGVIQRTLTGRLTRS